VNVKLTWLDSSRQLSQEGKKLAGDEPYMIRNGPFQELVLFAPDHLQEFLRKDARGERILFKKKLRSLWLKFSCPQITTNQRT
jgi:hypothetical protein